jgi:hypothetical protein
MDKTLRNLMIILVTAPWIVVLPYMLWMGLLIVFPDHYDSTDPHEIITAKEVWEQGLQPILLPIGIGAYAYCLLVVLIFVGSRKK